MRYAHLTMWTFVLAGLLALHGAGGSATASAEETSPGSPRVVRVIDSANPEPPMHEWHSHNRLNIRRGAYAGTESFTRFLIRKESGEIVPVPFFHFTLRDLGEIFTRIAQFPAETRVIAHEPTAAPLVHLVPDELEPGDVERWPNRGVLGGQFHSMNPMSAPQATEVLGRRAVRFSHNQWYKDSQFTSMVLDAMPESSLRHGKPFTFTAWVLHPDAPYHSQSSVMMSWHGRDGDTGTSLDWQRVQRWGSFSVDGLGADLILATGEPAQPMPEWTHLTYVYTGDGIEGELRIYENGHLVATATSDYAPELRPPSAITPTSAVLNGHLHASTPEVDPYVYAFIGEYDAFMFPQLRHIGSWERGFSAGRRGPGDFEIQLDALKPGTRYYYRIFAQQPPIENMTWTPNMHPTRRWAIGSGSFITPEREGGEATVFPFDEDRHIFLGSKWGSRWYAVFGGPTAFYNGYLGEVKLFDYAMSDEEVRRASGGLVPFNEQPVDGARVDTLTADFAWTRGSDEAERYVLHLDTDRNKVEAGSAPSQTLATPSLDGVTLDPGRTYHWRVTQFDAAGQRIEAGPVWQFHVTVGEPVAPTPADGATAPRAVTLEWQQQSPGVAAQRLYLGEDPQSVRASSTPVAVLDAEARSHRIETEPGSTYFWRVETELENGSTAPGPLWSFQSEQYFEPEFDGPVLEPYAKEFTPTQPTVIMEGMGHPTITNPDADEDAIREIAHATKRFLRKSRQLRNHLAAWPAATTMSTPESGAPFVHPYACGSYGGLPYWNMTMHEMGHQVEMHGMTPMDPDFKERLERTFNLRVNNNAWMADYAAVNLHENVAVIGHAFLCAKERERLLLDDPETIHLLAEYMPGDLAIDLHPAGAMELDAEGRVLGWTNRAGVESRDPEGQGYIPIPETVGEFLGVGSPLLSTVQGAAAVRFDGRSALVWDRGLQYGFRDNRAWSLEAWVRQDDSPADGGWIAGWGPEDRGVRLLWGASPAAMTICGETFDWPRKPEPGRWHHVAVVFEGGGAADTAGALRLFLNGEEILTVHRKLDLAAEMPVHIGGHVSDGQVRQGFTGDLAHVRVHTYALSEDQVVEQHYRAERPAYERPLPPQVEGPLLVDLDAQLLEETGAEQLRAPHRPLYPASLEKPWVRSWANRGTLGGRAHNDVAGEAPGSTPLYREVDGVQAVQFTGKERMVGVMDVRGAAVGQVAGTLELLVYGNKRTDSEILLQWGAFTLDARYLKPGWQHMAVLAGNDSRSEVYIDGRLAGTIEGTLRPGARQRLHLGAAYRDAEDRWENYFHGAIAAMRVHRDRLTAGQIAANATGSPVLAAYRPFPAHGSVVAPDRRPALHWQAGRDAPAAQRVRIGEDPGALRDAGTFQPGEYRPELATATRYFWRVGEGPVWSFETGLGKAISLSADDLAQGPLEVWENTGSLDGRFTPAARDEVLGLRVMTFNHKPAFIMEDGIRMVLRTEDGAPAVLEKGPFTLTFTATTEARRASVPFLEWGGDRDTHTRLWFGTHAADHRLVTRSRGAPQPADKAYAAANIPLAYPLMCRGRLAYTWGVWKTVAITYDGQESEIWYDGERLGRTTVDLSTDAAGDLVLGWDSAEIDTRILLNELRIYDRILDAGDIAGVAAGRESGGTAPVVRISAQDVAVDTQTARVPNTGRAGGAFVLDPGQDPDRRPVVRHVAGRNAVVFDGEAMLSSSFPLPEALADARPFTVEIWALQNAPSGRLLSLSRQISNRHTSFAMGSPADPAGMVRPRSDAPWQRIRRDEPLGQWVHLAWVYEGGMKTTVKLYRNGVLDSEHVYRTVDTIAGYPLTIGGIMTPRGDMEAPFRGAISDIRVYDYPRTAEEIAIVGKVE